MKKYLLPIIFLCMGIALPALAQNASLPSPDKLFYQPLQIKLPQAQRLVLDNGIILYIMEDKELPLVNINAIIRTGSMYDPRGKEGTAELTAHVMKTGGALNIASSQMDSSFDLLGSAPEISMSLETAEVSFSVLKENLEAGVNLFSQMLINPAFEDAKYNLAKELTKEGLRRLKDNPQRYSFREFNRLIYGDNDRGRYATIKSIGNIERADLLRFHKTYFSPDNIMMVVTGDISAESASQLISRYFGEWKKSGAKNIIPPPQQNRGGIFCINKEIPQSTIITGSFAPAKTDNNYYAFTILDFIIGSGGFSSRIFSAVRNEEGLAYSAGSFYRSRRDYGLFGAYAFTKNETTGKALSLINSIIDDVQNNSVKKEEIAWARKSINNGFIFSFLSTKDIAWQQMKIEYDNLPADYLTSYCDRINNVSADELKKAAAKYLNKSGNTTLILGNIKEFDNPLPGAVLINPEE